MDNFYIHTIKGGKNAEETIGKAFPEISSALSPATLSAGIMDPFDSLAIKGTRLQHLLNIYEARLGPEPVFSVSKDLDFQNFQSVFRGGLVDPALSNAVMLSLAFAASGGVINKECLVYRGQAIHHIRETMTSSDNVSESTIGAILLLVGVEARLGTVSQVDLHMGAVQLLLTTCEKSGVRLTEGIKRATFWQDLNSSVLVGSKRMFHHKSFAEIKWERDSISRDLLQLPAGFQIRSHLFIDEFIEVLEDIYALERIRDDYRPADCVVSGVFINGHTASIQSRLQALPKETSMSRCCYLGSYLCSVMLCCTVWCSLVIPANISTQLLHELQETYHNPVWDDDADLLLWLIYMGGAFSPCGPVRSSYINMLRSAMSERYGVTKSWTETYEILRDFLWSDVAFRIEVRKVWEEAFAQ
ncbi:hypothetical protein FPOA_00027 [Fusarium poae]|uniref:Transcription factor domain-containing protein n=1 Tax=Fusarium poae TaxID=36050 RepID=A0A1B8B034_FUSPO|nr:hypothetical protein FPOA_00027 [Fusarium poae]